MRLCILSDASGATNPAYPGHGLGQATHALATALLEAGHDVTLVAAQGSVFAGQLITPIAAGQAEGYDGEKVIASAAYKAHEDAPFDCFIDNGHIHRLSHLLLRLPVVNVYHDMWQPPERCPVFVSEGQRALFDDIGWALRGRVIHHWLDATQYAFEAAPDEPPYALYMGIVRDYKQPILAIEAAARYGIKLLMAGSMPSFSGESWLFAAYGNTEYVGTVTGAAKVKLLQGASVFLQLGTNESFGLSTVEAGLCGVPIVAWPTGGSVDIVSNGLNGVFPAFGGNKAYSVADAIEAALLIPRHDVHTSMLRFTDKAAWLNKWEAMIADCATGRWW